MLTGLREEVGIEFVAFFPTVESDFRFVIADFAHQRWGFATPDIRWIADDEIAEKWRVTRGEWRVRQGFEQIALKEVDAVGDAVTFGVAAGDSKCGGGNVRGEDRCAGEFLGQRNGDAAGTGADVGDAQAFAAERLAAAGTNFMNREAVERDFNDMLGFGAGNQDIGSDLEFEAPEFLLAGEVLCWFPGGATAKELCVTLGICGGKFFFGVRINPRSIVAKNVEE